MVRAIGAGHQDMDSRLETVGTEDSLTRDSIGASEEVEAITEMLYEIGKGLAVNQFEFSLSEGLNPKPQTLNPRCWRSRLESWS